MAARQAAVAFVMQVCAYRWNSKLPYGVTYNRALATGAVPAYAAKHRYSAAKTASVQHDMVVDREVQVCTGYSAFDAEGAYHNAHRSVVHVSVRETQSSSGVAANSFDDVFQYAMVNHGGRWLVDAEVDGS